MNDTKQGEGVKWTAKWIKPGDDYGDVCPVFVRKVSIQKPCEKAALYITALGVYEAVINEQRVSSFVLAPGWTAYDKRLQYQEYDVTGMLGRDNTIAVTVGKGWYRSNMPGWINDEGKQQRLSIPAGMTAMLRLRYSDGSEETIVTDESWSTAKGPVLFSEIYDGETFDATREELCEMQQAKCFDGPTQTLIPQEGTRIIEQERVSASKLIITPKGEYVIDFGQEVTGYIEIELTADKNEKIELSHGEILDVDGNFYNDNYRGAKAKYNYICKAGRQKYKPKFTFYGFRYVRVEQYPQGLDKIDINAFTAIAVYSEMEQTGYISSSNILLNKLFSNVLWGQRGNFLDVPTDCPQRDERLGWTGDAQVFIKTACLNFNTEQFFEKWLNDLAAEQGPDGYVGHVIPDLMKQPQPSAAWADAAVICPWQLYLAFCNKQMLARQYESMHKWVDYITSHTTTPSLWTGGSHYGDWLGLDAPYGSYKGSTREDFIASAFYAYSTSLVIRAGRELGENIDEYEQLYESIKQAFNRQYSEYRTQTECVLALHFKLAENPENTIKQLSEMLINNGIKLETGFVGTPYLLHVLSDNGRSDLAYALLLREQYPSWLYPVTKGATTIWEHWDGIKEDGQLWSRDMNSYNHYAYGAVMDWVYTVAGGINTDERYPGYEKVIIRPIPDSRLDWLNVSLKTEHGIIRSGWSKFNNMWEYNIETPVDAIVIIDGASHNVKPGKYIFYSETRI